MAPRRALLLPVLFLSLSVLPALVQTGNGDTVYLRPLGRTAALTAGTFADARQVSIRRIAFQVPRAFNFLAQGSTVEDLLMSVSDIYILDAVGAKPRRLIDGKSPAISPDGRRVAFCYRGSNGADEIRIVNINGSGLKTLVRMPGGACFPSWSPDGKKIAFNGNPAKDRSSEPEILVMDSDGNNLTPVARGTGTASWSPDGRRLLFCRHPPGKLHISVWVANADGGRVRHVPNLSVRMPGVAWLPDGKSFTFTGEDAKHRDVIATIQLVTCNNQL